MQRVLLALTLAAACGKPEPSVSPPTETGPQTGPENVVAQPGAFTARTVTIGAETFPYQVFVPKAYTTAQKWPVVVSIHGGNERGSDGLKQMTTGLAVVVKNEVNTFPAIAIFPQMPAGEHVGRDIPIAIATAALDWVLKAYSTDSKRVYLTGTSFGGGLIYEIALQNPVRFAAMAPISAIVCDFCVLAAPPDIAIGSSYPTIAKSLGSTPMWMFHGTDDRLVDIKYPRAADLAFKANGWNVLYTEFPGESHSGTWDKVYRMPAFYTWLWAQHR